MRRLVTLFGTIVGLVGRRPIAVAIRRRLWGWDVTIQWEPPDEDAESVGFVGPRSEDSEDDE